MGKGLNHVQTLTGVTGQIVLFPGQTVQQPSFQCTLHGWALYNSDSSTHNVKFYVPTPSKNQKPAIPDATGILVIQINVPAGLSKEFTDHEGWTFKDGLFVVTDNVDVIGSIFVS